MGGIERRSVRKKKITKQELISETNTSQGRTQLQAMTSSAGHRGDPGGALDFVVARSADRSRPQQNSPNNHPSRANMEAVRGLQREARRPHPAGPWTRPIPQALPPRERDHMRDEHQLLTRRVPTARSRQRDASAPGLQSRQSARWLTSVALESGRRYGTMRTLPPCFADPLSPKIRAE